MKDTKRYMVVYIDVESGEIEEVYEEYEEEGKKEHEKNYKLPPKYTPTLVKTREIDFTEGVSMRYLSDKSYSTFYAAMSPE